MDLTTKMGRIYYQQYLLICGMLLLLGNFSKMRFREMYLCLYFFFHPHLLPIPNIRYGS